MTMRRSSFAADGLAMAGLVLAILITRVEHFGTAFTPPDATLAVLFLAGLWVRRAWVFPVLLGAAALADQLAFRNGTSNWCVTAAYAFLIPTYACVWLAGLTSRQVDWLNPATAVRGAGNLLSSLIAAFVVSSGSFFLLSGDFPGASGLEYWRAVARYFPAYAGWPVVYVSVGLAVAGTLRMLERRRARTLPALRYR
jgi:hypothetical protein